MLFLILRPSKLIRLLKSITCTSSRNNVHKRNDTHNMHDITQILSFISAYRFFRGNRSVMSRHSNDEENRRLTFEFWASSGNSRPTGNNNDVKRKRLGRKDYIEHKKQILEKTQSEIFHNFKRKYPEIAMKQRALENCKPFLLCLLSLKIEILAVAASM